MINRRLQFALIAVVFVGVVALTYSLKKKSEPFSLNKREGLSVLDGAGLDSAPQPKAAKPTYPESAVPVTEHDRELEKVLSQILVSRNDNDPRLDSLFKNLSPGTKYLLRQKYQSLPLESRNERGTIVFLLGRDLPLTGDAQDYAFLNSVAVEPRCLSLSDCTKETKSGPEDSHEESTIGVSLNYPQYVTLHAIQGVLESSESAGSSPSSPPSKEALRTLDELTHSSVPAISSQAKKLQAKYGQPVS